MKRLVIYAVVLAVTVLSVNAQEVFRTFDYQSPDMTPATAEAKPKIASQLRNLLDKKFSESAHAAKVKAAYEANDKATLKAMKVKYDDVSVEKLNKILEDTILLDSEKIDIVVNALGTDKEQLAAIGKVFVDEGDFMSADAVERTLIDKHPRYAYTNLFSAYNHQALGLKYSHATDNLSRQNKMSELNGAAMLLEELAKSAKDSVEVYRNLLMTAGGLRYEALEEGMCRTDFNEVLKLHPSEADSMDIAVMLAYFDRAQAAEALRNEDMEQAMNYYDRAIEGYGGYLNSTANLPHDIYTADAVDGYLFCKSNRAAIQRKKNTKDISGYHELLKEAGRFLPYCNDDIRPYRYKLTAYFQMCMADSTQFRGLRNEYMQSMAYITDKQFVDSLYTYDDYNMVQQGATWSGDDAMRAEYLKKCIATYNGENGEVKGNLMSALAVSAMRGGDHMAEINARKQLIDEVLKNDPNADISTNELNLAKAYFNLIATEKENRTLPIDSIYYYADLGNTILNKYLNSTNEDYAANATQQKYNALVDLLAIAEGDARTKYYEEYRDALLDKIEWSKENDFSNVQRHTRNLFLVTYNYILSTKEEAELPAVAGSSYQLFYRQFEGEQDESVRPEMAAAYLLNINHQLEGRLEQLKAGEPVITAVCDTVDRYMALMNHGTTTDPTMQQLQYRYYTELRQNYVNGADFAQYQQEFDRKRFLTNYAAIQDKGCTAYLDEFIRSNKAHNFYHDNIVSKNPDLTPSEKKLAYFALGRAYYSAAVASYDNYSKRKTSENSDIALKDFERAYYYSAKSVKTGDDRCAGNVSTLADFKFAQPAIEKARETLAQEEAPAPTAAPPVPQAEKE